MVTLIVVAIDAKCPEIAVEKMYPCLCLRDTDEIHCRASETKMIDDQVFEKAINAISSSLDPGLGSKLFKKLTITQTDITTISDKVFKDLMFEEVHIRYNFRLKSIHRDAFLMSSNVLKNISFGEVATYYETKTSDAFNLDFLKHFELHNLFLNGINIAFLDESIFKNLATNSVTKLYLNSLYFECGCKIKWIFELDEQFKKPFYGPYSGLAMDANPLSCDHVTLKTLLPMRALSKADFSNC